MVTGGDKMSAYLNQMLQALATANEVKAGFLEGPLYPDGTPVALVAAVNEYGDQQTPARPFIRPAIANDQDKWHELLAHALIDSKFNAADALDGVGFIMTESIGNSLRKVSGPALAASTIAEKHSDTILVDTGKMLESIDYKVE